MEQNISYLEDISGIAPGQRDLQHGRYYAELTRRNIGYVTQEEQRVIQNTHVAILGVGGIGGPLAHILVHAGIEKLTLLDRDFVEVSNLNRQPYGYPDRGRFKVEVMERDLRGINPYIHVRTFRAVSPRTVNALLEDVDVVVLSLDGPAASILIARECRKREIPLLEAWATPLIFTRWFTPQSMDYETCYNLDTHTLTAEEIYDNTEVQKKISDSIINTLLEIPNIIQDLSHDPQAFRMMMEGKLPLRSFAPIVWSVSSYAALDLIYAGILGRKEMVLAPNVIGFDPIRMKLRKIKLGGKKSI